MRVNVVNFGQGRAGEGVRVNVSYSLPWAQERAFLLPVSLLVDTSGMPDYQH